MERSSGIVVNLATLESWNESLAKANRRLEDQVTFLARSVLGLTVALVTTMVAVLVLVIALVVIPV